jgi:hypothetical protein
MTFKDKKFGIVGFMGMKDAKDKKSMLKEDLGYNYGGKKIDTMLDDGINYD